jgi:hypothetical protein
MGRFYPLTMRNPRGRVKSKCPEVRELVWSRLEFAYLPCGVLTRFRKWFKGQMRTLFKRVIQEKDEDTSYCE